MKALLVVLISLLSAGQIISAQTENILLQRDYWKGQPTIDDIQSKIDAGHSPTEMTPYAFDAACYAILEKNPTETVLFLLDQGNDVNKITHDSRNYMFWAAYRSNLPLMKKLLKMGSRTDIIDSHGNSVLMFAASTGQTDPAVYAFCEANGMSLTDERDRSGRNALLAVASRLSKDFSILDRFVEKGLSAESVDTDGNGLFYYASRAGNIDLLDKVVEMGAKPNMNVEAGSNAFLYATYNNDIELSFYKHLESLGLDPAITSVTGKNALHNIARGNKSSDIFSYFLEKGADINATDEDGNTPLMIAASRNDKVIVQYLLNNGSEVNHMNEEGHSALTNAIRRNKADVVSLLIAKGAATDAVDKKGYNLAYHLVSAYQASQKEATVEKMKMLTEKGVDPSSVQADKSTLLHAAIEKQDLDLIQMVLGYGVDVNAQSTEGYTALHLAAMKSKNEEMLKVLIDAGADKAIKTEFEELAYDLASENELLQESGVDISFLNVE